MRIAIFLGLTLPLFLPATVRGQTANPSTSQAPRPAKNVVVSDIHGTELLRLCNMQGGTIEMQFCEAFIVGVRDGVVLATRLRDAKPIFETPAEAKQEQLRAVVVKYLNDHPEEHHKPGALLVIFALGRAFPPKDNTAK